MVVVVREVSIVLGVRSGRPQKTAGCLHKCTDGDFVALATSQVVLGSGQQDHLLAHAGLSIAKAILKTR